MVLFFLTRIDEDCPTFSTYFSGCVRSVKLCIDLQYSMYCTFQLLAVHVYVYLQSESIKYPMGLVRGSIGLSQSYTLYCVDTYNNQRNFLKFEILNLR